MIRIKMPDTDLGQICESGQCFRMRNINKEGEYEIIAGDKRLIISQKEDELIMDCAMDEYERFWKNYFDADTDYGKIKALADDTDPYLKRAVARGYGIRILKQDLWEMIVTFLISQQNNIPRIRKCIENICRAYGEEKLTETGESYYSFPTAKRLGILEEDALMECNLGYRSKYVVRTAKDIISGKFDLDAIMDMDYESSREELPKMYGVGKKVADCVCLFALHHVDAFPIDTHIRQVLDREYSEGFPFKKYAGYLGIMQQYIFYYDLHGDEN